MGNRSSSDDIVPFVVVGVVLAGLAAIWKFSSAFGLDMSTGATVLGYLAIDAVLLVLSLKFGGDYEIVRLKNVAPLLVAIAWVGFWPALDYWAAHAGPTLRFDGQDVTTWYNAWYTECGVLAAILGGGYFIRHHFFAD